MRLRLVYQPDVEHVGYVILADAAKSVCLLALPRAFYPIVAALSRHAPALAAGSIGWPACSLSDVLLSLLLLQARTAGVCLHSLMDGQLGCL